MKNKNKETKLALINFLSQKDIEIRDFSVNREVLDLPPDSGWKMFELSPKIEISMTAIKKLKK